MKYKLRQKQKTFAGERGSFLANGPSGDEADRFIACRNYPKCTPNAPHSYETTKKRAIGDQARLLWSKCNALKRL